MGVAAANNTFNVFNTGRLLLRLPKSTLSCIASAATKAINKTCCVNFAEFAHHHGCSRNIAKRPFAHLIIKKFDPFIFKEGRGHK